MPLTRSKVNILMWRLSRWIQDLGTSYSLGIRYFLENTHVDAVFPMHCWGQYEVCRKLQKEPELNGMLEHYYPIKDTAQEWNL